MRNCGWNYSLFCLLFFNGEAANWLELLKHLQSFVKQFHNVQLYSVAVEWTFISIKAIKAKMERGTLIEILKWNACSSSFIYIHRCSVCWWTQKLFKNKIWCLLWQRVNKFNSPIEDFSIHFIVAMNWLDCLQCVNQCKLREHNRLEIKRKTYHERSWTIIKIPLIVSIKNCI